MYDNYSTKCGKLSFADEYDAEKKIEQREFDKPGWQGQPYKCSNCGKWHITSKNNNEAISDDVISKSRKRIVENKNRKKQQSHNTVEGSRAVSSFGDSASNSGSSILESLDEETLRKLGLC